MRGAFWLAMAVALASGCGRERPRGVRAWFSPHQNWDGGRGFVSLPDSNMTQNDPLSGPVFQELDRAGRVIRSLDPPPGLMASTWFEYRPHPLWVDGAIWTCGIPAHPAWYRLYRKVHSPGPTFKKTQNHPHYLVPTARGTLFRSRDFGPWEAVASYRPDTGFGYVAGFVPLRNGSFLGLAHSEFGRGQDRSPLATFRLSPGGSLELEALLPLDPSGALPSRATGKLNAKGREERVERPEAHAFWRVARVIPSPQGLVVVGAGGGVALLDARDGRPLRLSLPPGGEEWRPIDWGQCQPAPDGTLYLCLYPRGSFNPTRFRAPLTPATDLAGFAFGRAPFKADMPNRWFRVDPGTGQWIPWPTPAGDGGRLRSRHLRIWANGTLGFWDKTPVEDE